MRCTGCQVMRIQGVLCHELGCTEQWKTERRECKECGSCFTPLNRSQVCCDWDCHAAYYGIDDLAELEA